MNNNNNISRVAQLLREASNILSNEVQDSPSADTTQTNASNIHNRTPALQIVNNTVNRTRQMLQQSSSNGLFRRLNNNERLRAASSNNTSHATYRSKKEKLPILKKHLILD